MLDHLTLRVRDMAASERFYATVLRTLGVEPTFTGPELPEWDDFSIAPADAGHPPSARVHIGFMAPSRAHVDEFWRTGTRDGYRDDGAPGERAYTADYYGAFLLDPDGNSAEAVHHGSMRPPGNIDHVWIRVADVAASKRFYDAIAPHTGFARADERDDHGHYVGGGASFSVVAGTPSEHVHLAFGAADQGTVDAFHANALAAGYRDNGAPGERPEYHPGYYGAYVLDPDGNNVEVVHHDRG